MAGANGRRVVLRGGRIRAMALAALLAAGSVSGAQSRPGVLIAGDSLALGAAAALSGELSAMGLASEVEATVGSGLVRRDIFDWPAHFAGKGPRRTAVILSIGTNDFNPVATKAGRIGFGTPAWDTEYRSRLAAVIRGATAGGTALILVSPPPMRDADLERAAVRVSRLASEEAARGGAFHCDTRGALTAAPGFVESEGRTRIRDADGVHMTPEGSLRFARRIGACLRHALAAGTGTGGFRPAPGGG